MKLVNIGMLNGGPDVEYVSTIRYILSIGKKRNKS
jgi:hypothetical protein